MAASEEPEPGFALVPASLIKDESGRLRRQSVISRIVRVGFPSEIAGRPDFGFWHKADE
jgi:hypothetical protein